MKQPKPAAISKSATVRAALALWCFLSAVAHAQVLKCVDRDGNIQFSNVGCPAGTSQRSVEVRPNAVDMSGLREQAASLAAEKARSKADAMQSYSAQQGPQAARSSCPSELDIRNMEVSVSSPSLGKKERAFHEAEIRRARQCRAGEGAYTEADWKASKEALAGQRKFKAEDRRQERARAEGIHSAANPREGDRIAQDRLAEEIREDARQQAAAAAAARAAPRLITSCDARGCWDNQGGRYNGSGSTLLSTTGKACDRVGNMLQCSP